MQTLIYKNFIRICAAHGIERKKYGSGQRLAELLGASRQHATQLLSGTSTIGDETIKKLCTAWSLDRDEFTRKEETKMKEDSSWELKMLMESMTKRIDDLSSRHEAIVKLVTVQREELTKIYDFGLEMQRSITNVNHAIDDINARLGMAVETGDIKTLKKACGE